MTSHWSINNRQENAGTSYLAGEEVSDSILDFTIVFNILRNPLPQYFACSAYLLCQLAVLRSAFFTAPLSFHISPFSYLTFTQIHWSLWDIVQRVFSYISIKCVVRSFLVCVYTGCFLHSWCCLVLSLTYWFIGMFELYRAVVFSFTDSSILAQALQLPALWPSFSSSGISAQFSRLNMQAGACLCLEIWSFHFWKKKKNCNNIQFCDNFSCV